MGASNTESTDGARLTLEIWHPNCWTLEVTEGRSAGLLAHTVYNATDGRVKGHFTAYGNSAEGTTDLIEATRSSPLTDSVVVRGRRQAGEGTGSIPGNDARELFVEYDPTNTISDALASEGFIQEAPVRVRDGAEYWSVFVGDSDRDRLHERLERVREREDAEVTVTRITSQSTFGDVTDRIALLTVRQREIFELACEHGYYSWPREVTTRELADLADVSKTTLLEHLRKAESKLLDPAIEEVTNSL